MKFLSDIIEVTINGLHVRKDGMYRYDIIINQEVIFVGNTFISIDDEYKTFYLNDILNNYRFKGDVKEGLNPNVYNEVEVYLYIDDVEYTNSVNVMFLHQYPNYNSNISTSLDVESGYWTPMLQGSNFYDDGRLSFIPTYPCICSKKLHYNYLGMYNGVFSTLDIDSQQIRAYEKDSGRYTSDDYSITFASPNYGVHGTNQYTISDIICDDSIGAYTKQVYAITPINLRYNGSTNFRTTIYDQKEHSWICRTNPLNTGIGGVRVTLTHPTDSSKNVVYNSVFVNPFLISTDKYCYEGYTNVSVEIIGTNNRVIGNLSFNSTKLYNHKNSNYVVPLHFMFEYDSTTKILTVTTAPSTIDFSEIQPDEIIIDTNGTLTTVAKLDRCSRYFLKWMDRYGMAQIQPFDTATTFSEDISYTEIINYKNERKKSSISTQPKWKLNTKWLDKNVYPFYESIYVSPYLQLYDAKEDQLYDVILTNTDYTEKTFKNQGNQMFNLQIDVELDRKQNMVY